MSRKRILNDEQIDEMIEMREAGKSDLQIALHFAAQDTTISPQAINWQCLVHGADRPAHRRHRRNPAPPPTTYVRGGVVVRQFTPAEDRQLLELEAAGQTYSEIGRAMGRKSNSIRGRLMTLARRQAREEEEVA